MSGIATAVIGSAAIGYIASDNAASRQEDIANNQMAQTAAIQGQQLALANRQQDQSDDYYNYSKGTFRPLEQGMVNEAATAGAAAEQEQQAGAAAGAVRDSLAKNQAATTRNLARMGINPNSSRAIAAMRGTDVSGALAEAVASNSARQQAKTLGWQKRVDAASLGRNLPTNATAASAAAGTVLGSAGQLGVASANSALAAQSSIASINSENMSGIGSLAGMALKYGSTGTSAAPRQGLFSGNSSDALSNPNADMFNTIGHSTAADPLYG